MLKAHSPLEALALAALEYDERLNDSKNDGRDAQPPTGDDYNELFDLVMKFASDANAVTPWCERCSGYVPLTAHCAFRGCPRQKRG
jgi:hypothetical protein